MTRYARANGSKSCNARVSADPTPWSEMVSPNKRAAESIEDDDVTTPKKEKKTPKKTPKVVKLEPGTPKSLAVLKSPVHQTSPLVATTSAKKAKKTPLKQKATETPKNSNTPQAGKLSQPSPVQTRSARKKKAELNSVVGTPSSKGVTPTKTVKGKNLNTKTTPKTQKSTPKGKKIIENEEFKLELDEDEEIDSDDLDSDDNIGGNDSDDIVSDEENFDEEQVERLKAELQSIINKPVSSKSILKTTKTPIKVAKTEATKTPLPTQKEKKIVETSPTPKKLVPKEDKAEEKSFTEIEKITSPVTKKNARRSVMAVDVESTDKDAFESLTKSPQAQKTPNKKTKAQSKASPVQEKSSTKEVHIPEKTSVNEEVAAAKTPAKTPVKEVAATVKTPVKKVAATVKTPVKEVATTAKTPAKTPVKEVAASAKTPAKEVISVNTPSKEITSKVKTPVKPKEIATPVKTPAPKEDPAPVKTPAKTPAKTKEAPASVETPKVLTNEKDASTKELLAENTPDDAKKAKNLARKLMLEKKKELKAAQSKENQAPKEESKTSEDAEEVPVKEMKTEDSAIDAKAAKALAKKLKWAQKKAQKKELKAVHSNEVESKESTIKDTLSAKGETVNDAAEVSIGGTNKSIVHDMIKHLSSRQISLVDRSPKKKNIAAIAEEERYVEVRQKLVSSGKTNEEIDRELPRIMLAIQKRIKETRCLRCRKKGHMQRDCPVSKTRSSNKCYKCGDATHNVKDCSIKEDVFTYADCFICHKTGHLTRTCPNNPKGIYPQGGGCFKCGDKTHLSKFCPGAKRSQQNETHEMIHKNVVVGVLNSKQSADADITDTVVEKTPIKALKQGNKKRVVKF